jgi:hypothetical protein
VNRSCTIGCRECHQFGNFLRLTGSADWNASNYVHDLPVRTILVDAAALWASCTIMPCAPDVSMNPGEIMLTRTPVAR